jgi:uncharacterized YigZ family protein
LLPKQIKTIKNFHSVSFKEKGSEFVSIVYPVDCEKSALDYLNEIRKKYFDATHHCFAYKIKSGEFKYSDDGEPSGTAGIRIFNAIDHFDLTDLLLIVVRYFGGTKLGVGPLGKAYYNASINVIQATETVTRNLYQSITIEVDFNFVNHVYRVINFYSAIIYQTEFSTSAKFYCYIKPDDSERINIELTNLTNGQVLIKMLTDFKYFL